MLLQATQPDQFTQSLLPFFGSLATITALAAAIVTPLKNWLVTTSFKGIPTFFVSMLVTLILTLIAVYVLHTFTGPIGTILIAAAVQAFFANGFHVDGVSQSLASVETSVVGTTSTKTP